jgi:REP element-mobilizing transposase RayT
VEWLPVFTRKPYFEAIINPLQFYRQNKGLKVFAYVIMDNHLHMIVGSDNLSKVLKEFKSFTAREIIRVATEERKNWLLNQFKFYKKERKESSYYQVWQEGFHPKQITSEEVLHQKI